MKCFVILILVAIIIYVCAKNVHKSITIQKLNGKLAELEKWHEMALVDALTKIPNRAAYIKHVEHLSKNRCTGKSIGIILFDVDDFKRINDTFGHLAGDRALQNVAEMLNEVFCYKNYSVYRIGGDEFATIAEDVSEEEIIERMIRLSNLERLTENISLAKGYAMISEKESFCDAFLKADEMLYADKATRK